MQISQENTCGRVSLSKVAGLKACNFIKKRLQYRCFPVKFEEILRAPILKNTSGGYFSTKQMRKTVLETSCPVLLPKVEWRFQKQKKVKFCRRFLEVYSELNQASKTELFVKTINCLRKKLYLRCLTRFWMCLLFSSINSYANWMNIL